MLPIEFAFSRCLALEEQAPVEYLKQLVLTGLTNCCYEELDEKMEPKADLNKLPNSEGILNFACYSSLFCTVGIVYF